MRFDRVEAMKAQDRTLKKHNNYRKKGSDTIFDKLRGKQRRKRRRTKLIFIDLKNQVRNSYNLGIYKPLYNRTNYN